jgi:glycosyltransferase involved in cell wall biosynthesis
MDISKVPIHRRLRLCLFRLKRHDPGMAQQIDSNAPGGVREDIQITFFVPCLNEERYIAATIETVVAAASEFPWKYEVIVVDDGSIDRTSSIVTGFCQANPSAPVRLLRNPLNLGLARSFLDTAFNGRGRHYRLICGDNVEPKESMVAVLKHMGEADIIMPYYPDLLGKTMTGKFLSKTYNSLVNFISGHHIKYYNGNPLYIRHCVMRWAPHNSGFGYQADLVTQLLDIGSSYIEVPIVGLHREKGGSSLKLRGIMSVGHSLFEISLRRVYGIIFGPQNSRQATIN